MRDFWKSQDKWDKFKERYCKSCVNKVFCLINEDDNNFKAIPKRKTKHHIVCENYKARYLGTINNL